MTFCTIERKPLSYANCIIMLPYSISTLSLLDNFTQLFQMHRKYKLSMFAFRDMIHEDSQSNKLRLSMHEAHNYKRNLYDFHLISESIYNLGTNSVDDREF